MTKELMSLDEITRIESMGFTSVTKIEDELKRLFETARAAHEWKDDSEFARKDADVKIRFLTEQLAAANRSIERKVAKFMELSRTLEE